MVERIGAGKRIGILTSGGDAQGMNAAVRAVVRTAITLGAEVYAVYEGYQGMIDGGDGIRRFGWDDVGNVLHRGGTVIGTFRSKEFRERDGRRKAARNLLAAGIDRLVVIGGDGSLSGLDAFRTEWPELLAELVEAGELDAATAAEHPALMIAGLVGSIDNDLVGTDMTIGADTALHRIVSAIDDLASTAASHQRSFVVEVMGRHCGYLALMAAVAGGCDYVLTPENPPADGWEDRMCAELRRGRKAGRRDSIVLVAEGATDRSGNPISSEQVRGIIEQRLGEDTRVTILGHVQRGGTPSAFDRWCSTWLGYEAAHAVLSADPGTPGRVFGFRGNRVMAVDLMEAVRNTREVPKLIEAGDYDAAMAKRGGSFVGMTKLFAELAEPSRVSAGDDSRRIGIIHGGGLAPGMNTAARAAVRLGISRGHTMLGIHDGFPGLRDGKITELTWGDVEAWTADGGAKLGLRRTIPPVEELYTISRQLEDHKIDALLVIGGWNAYQAAHLLYNERDRYPAFRIPIVCVPASIDNNLPGSELAIGTDTALNVIVEAIDRIKLSASATKRSYVVETMGRYCGYLALMGGLAGGAERVYLHEEGITLEQLNDDVKWLRRSFAAGRSLFLAVRNERANEHYTTNVIAGLLEEEGRGLYDVRQGVLGHQQQGGSPTPFDRLLATRLVGFALNLIAKEFADEADGSYLVGLTESKITEVPMASMLSLMDRNFRRPKNPWWLQLRDVTRAVAEEPETTDA
ncbi:MAG: 6-phosphofructokinase [Micropruina sp.]|uniref:6-phosphofructokinase n=1 Tax=Micropruina sp. TaxID=2737536 RepID=UPI0039E44CA1